MIRTWEEWVIFYWARLGLGDSVSPGKELFSLDDAYHQSIPSMYVVLQI